MSRDPAAGEALLAQLTQFKLRDGTAFTQFRPFSGHGGVGVAAFACLRKCGFAGDENNGPIGHEFEAVPC